MEGYEVFFGAPLVSERDACGMNFDGAVPKLYARISHRLVDFKLLEFWEKSCFCWRPNKHISLCATCCCSSETTYQKDLHVLKAKRFWRIYQISRWLGVLDLILLMLLLYYLVLGFKAWCEHSYWDVTREFFLEIFHSSSLRRLDRTYTDFCTWLFLVGVLIMDERRGAQKDYPFMVHFQHPNWKMCGIYIYAVYQVSLRGTIEYLPNKLSRHSCRHEKIFQDLIRSIWVCHVFSISNLRLGKPWFA